MNELDRLMKEREEIDAKIRELTVKERVCGTARFRMKDATSEYRKVAINSQNISYDGNLFTRWSTVISAPTVDKVKEKLAELIKDLQDLQSKIKNLQEVEA
ncbi:MAG: hypothetical protein IKF99_11075 [Oscillospiraceae bacterium]|nr:hypothetical protein [Oscillospiraceae bacterium]